MSIKVLLVDDEEDFTSSLSQRMHLRGFDVAVANDGYAALNKVKASPYDAVILDLDMPGPDGLETLKLLLEEDADLQVIFLTGQATVEKGVYAVKLGAMDFLEKPLDLEQLLSKIREAGNRRELLRQKDAAQDVDDILRDRGW